MVTRQERGGGGGELRSSSTLQLIGVDRTRASDRSEPCCAVLNESLQLDEPIRVGESRDFVTLPLRVSLA